MRGRTMLIPMRHPPELRQPVNVFRHLGRAGATLHRQRAPGNPFPGYVASVDTLLAYIRIDLSSDVVDRLRNTAHRGGRGSGVRRRSVEHLYHFSGVRHRIGLLDRQPALWRAGLW